MCRVVYLKKKKRKSWKTKEEWNGARCNGKRKRRGKEKMKNNGTHIFSAAREFEFKH